MPNNIFDCFWICFGICCNFLWFFKMAKSLSFKEYIWVKDWYSVRVHIKWFYAQDLSGLDNEIIFIVASEGVCWSVGTNAAHLSDYCWQQELIALLLQRPCGCWTYVSQSCWLSPVSSFLTSVHLDCWRLWKSWRNILIYELLLSFCYKANRIKSYCCILFSHFGTRICIVQVGFVFYTHVVIFFCMPYIVYRSAGGLVSLLFSLPTNQWKTWKEMLGYRGR